MLCFHHASEIVVDLTGKHHMHQMDLGLVPRCKIGTDLDRLLCMSGPIRGN
jgi:hypothetical protein